MAIRKKIIVELSAKNEAVVKRALQGLGVEGERALRKIETASKPSARGIKRVDRATRGLEGAMSGMAGRAGVLGTALSALGPAGLAAAAGIGGAVAGIAAAMRRARLAMDELDKLDDTARKLGVTVEGLQELRFVADQVNIPVATLEMGLQRLGRRIGTVDRFLSGATTEGKAFADAFAELGVKIHNADGTLRSVDQILPDLADGFAKVESQTTRLTLAQKLLDSEGVSLLLFLQDGAAALDVLRAKARDMGVVLSESVVRQASAAADEIAALEKSTASYWKVLDVKMLPTLLEVERGWNKFTKSITQSIAAMHDARQELSNLLDDAGRESMAAAGFPLPPPTAGAGVEILMPPPLAKTLPSPPSPGSGTERGKGSKRAKFPEQFGPGIELFERATAEAERAIERISDANMRAVGDIIGLIEVRRDRELAALEDIALSEEQTAEARRLINDTATRDIAEANERLAAGNKRAAEAATEEWSRFGGSATQTLASLAIQGDLTVDSILQSFSRLATNKLFQMVFAGGAGGGGDIFAGLFGGGGGSSGFAGVAGSPRAAGIVHGGGVIGADRIRTRTLPAALWDTAPRLHGGLAPDEFPAVLQQGEGVFTRGQMAAMGRVNVTVNNNGGAQIDVREQRGPQGVDVVIDVLEPALAQRMLTHGTLINRTVRDVSGGQSRLTAR